MSQRYVWNKYSLTSSQGTRTVYLQNSESVGGVSLSRTPGEFYVIGSSYTFSSTTGRFTTTSNSTYEFGADGSPVSRKSGYISQGSTMYYSSNSWQEHTNNNTLRTTGATKYSSTPYQETYTQYSKGSFLSAVSSASSGKYPSNSYSGNYWYVYQGQDNIDPQAVTIPTEIYGGSEITITVTPSASQQYSGAVSYTYQYQTDNGPWVTIGTSASPTQEFTVPYGATTVAVQAQAQDNLGFVSSTWVQSQASTVINNQPPTAPGSIEATNVISGQTATITLTAATDPDGTIASYVYERSVDGGAWQQVANVNSLTQTDSVSADWGTVAYRAAAVDNSGVQGPYNTSETYTVNSGWVIVGGPVSNLGVQNAAFVIPLVVNVTGGSGVTGINLQVLLDGAQIFNDALNQGASVSLPIDTRAMASGQHEIQAIAEKTDYLSASVAWYFVVPSISLASGGYTMQLSDDAGDPIFPTTFARNVMGPNGKSVQTELDELASAHQGINGHLAFVDAVLGPNGSYTVQRASATTYAYQYFAPAAADTSSQALVSVYPAYTGTIGTLLTADAGTLTFNVPANGILALWEYVTDVTPPASTDPTVNFTPLIQPQVVTAATNTGNTASDLDAALTAMMKAFPSQNYYAIVDAMDNGVTYYVASQAIITATTPSASVAYASSANPTTWYQGVQLTFADTRNMPAQFSYMSSPIVTAATSANPVTAGTSLNATLTAMIKAQPSYNRYLLENGSGGVYYICSPTEITADTVSVVNVLYCTASGSYYNGETLTLVQPTDSTPEVTE